MTATSTDLVRALERHYRGGPGHRDQDAFATWQELTSPDGRRIDYLAMGLWASRGRSIDGHEIKVSRADWLHELAQPSKAEQWFNACHRWWLVVPDESIVQGDELPPGWGLMIPPAASKRSMRVLVKPSRRDVPAPGWLTVAMVKRDRAGHADRLRSAVHQAENTARHKGYEEGRKALENRTGRILTSSEKERLELFDRIEERLGQSVERYVFTSSKNAATAVEPETAALALQVTRALQSVDGRHSAGLGDLLDRITKLTDAAKELRAARAAVAAQLAGSV